MFQTVKSLSFSLGCSNVFIFIFLKFHDPLNPLKPGTAAAWRACGRRNSCRSFHVEIFGTSCGRTFVALVCSFFWDIFMIPGSLNLINLYNVWMSIWGHPSTFFQLPSTARRLEFSSTTWFCLRYFFVNPLLNYHYWTTYHGKSLYQLTCIIGATPRARDGKWSHILPLNQWWFPLDSRFLGEPPGQGWKMSSTNLRVKSQNSSRRSCCSRNRQGTSSGWRWLAYWRRS